MEDYNKIIESLNVKFYKTNNIKILQSIHIKNHYDVQNYIFLLHDGELTIGQENVVVSKGDMLFLPGGKLTSVGFGPENEQRHIDNEEYNTNFERYLEVQQDVLMFGKVPDSYSFVSFDAKVFDSINFFSSLDIPPFIIHNNPVLARLIKDITIEKNEKISGKNRIIQLKTEQIAIEIIRYILQNGLFVEQLATKVTYFKDPRLIEIFAHIKNDLGGDLSNKVLSVVANVSEDYVGQFFKLLTGINPQDYIEYQRMEMAVNLLRTSKKSIRDIGVDVGYKDTAYFCRRFKMMFGIPAGKMRRRDTLMNMNMISVVVS